MSFMYSTRHKFMRELFFIILYPYFTLKGLIFMLEVKFQSFLAEPTHMPDISSEQFDLTPKDGPLKIVSMTHHKIWIFLNSPYSNLNKILMNFHRNAVFCENLVFTPKILGWTGHYPSWFIMVTRGQFLKYQLIVVMH